MHEGAIRGGTLHDALSAPSGTMPTRADADMKLPTYLPISTEDFGVFDHNVSAE